MSALPSALALSTTMTPNCASSLTRSRLARQALRSSLVFQLQIVMLRSRVGMRTFGRGADGPPPLDEHDSPATLT